MLSPSAVLESNFSFNRSTPDEQVPTPPDEFNVSLIRGRDLGSVNVTAGDGLPGLTEAGTDRTNPKSFFNNTWQLSTQSLDPARPARLVEMGALFERFEFEANSESRTRGRLEFRSLRRLLADEPRRIEGASAQSDFARSIRQSLLGLYLQDDIRVTRSFTLFAGLRWEFVTTPSEAGGKISNFTDIWSPDGAVIVQDPRFADPDAADPCSVLPQAVRQPDPPQPQPSFRLGVGSGRRALDGPPRRLRALLRAAAVLRLPQLAVSVAALCRALAD